MSHPTIQIIGVDTNIFLDYLLDRKNEFGKPLGDDAWKVFSRAIRGEFKIVISKWLSYQILEEAEPEKFKVLFTILESRNALVWVDYTQEDIEEAKKYSTDIDDPMHAILARKGGAKIIVTRNVRDYDCCQSIIEAKVPEQL